MRRDKGCEIIPTYAALPVQREDIHEHDMQGGGQQLNLRTTHLLVSVVATEENQWKNYGWQPVNAAYI